MRNLIRARVTCSGMVAEDDSGDGEEDPTGKRDNSDWEISRGFAQKPKEPSNPFVIYGKRNDCLNKWWFFNYMLDDDDDDNENSNWWAQHLEQLKF